MATKEEKSQIKQLLESLFSKNDNISFFFLKKSKIKPEFEYQIPFKTKKKVSADKAYYAQKQLQKELGAPWEFVQWSQFIGKIVPESKVHKIPFFDTQNIEIKNPWRICPIGQHWVKRHPKQLKKGKITDHDGHCRKNPSKKDLLKGDEMELIATSDLFLNPKVKVSKINLKMPRGLLQLTEQTTRLAKSHKQHEYKDHFIDLEYEDLWDPNKNISFGVRHLFRKRETAKARLKREPTWFEVLMDYKGRLKSKTTESAKVREKLKNILNEMDTE